MDRSRFVVIPGGKSLKPVPKPEPAKIYLVCAGCLAIREEQEPFRPCECGRYGVTRRRSREEAEAYAARYKKYRANTKAQQERRHG